MIWALLFAALFSVLGGDSPYLVPKMNKYVKKCVVDKEKEKQILELLKESKTEKKAYSKVNKKLEKQVKNIFHNRNATQLQFDELYSRIAESRNAYQGKNQEVAVQVQKFIKKDEWQQIKVLIQKDITKKEKNVNKLSAKVTKKFEKLKSNITQTVIVGDSREKILLEVDNYQKILEEAFKGIIELILDENSVHYKYNVSKEELSNLQDQINNGLKEILDAQTELHFALVENTTEEEWKKIHKKVKVVL